MFRYIFICIYLDIFISTLRCLYNKIQDGIFFHILLKSEYRTYSYISLAPWQPNWRAARQRRSEKAEKKWRIGSGGSLGAAVVASLDKIHSASARVALRQLAWQTCQVAVKLPLKHTV